MKPQIQKSELSVPRTLMIVCCECGKLGEVPLDDDKFDTKRIYREKGWVMSVQTKDAPHRHVMLVPVCDDCAPKVMSPELLAAARQELGQP